MNQEETTQEFSFEDIASQFSVEAPSGITEVELDLTDENEEQLPPVPTTELEIQEPKEEVTPKEKENKTVQNFTNYNSVVKTLLNSGEWEDILIEKEDGTEIKLSELEEIPEEEFKQIIEDQKALKAEDAKDKYVPVENLSEDKKAILDILLKGGDLKEIFKDPQALVKPYTEELGWDLDNEVHQQEIAFRKYKRLGHSDAKAKSLVEIDIKENELDLVAKEEVKIWHEGYDNKLKKIAQDLEAEKIAEQEKLKEYKSNLNKLAKEAQYPETLVKKIVDLGTKKTENGNIASDELYEKLIEDPKEALELIFFMADKEKYLAEKMKEVKRATQIDGMRKISRIAKETSKKPVETETSKEDTFSVEILNN
jgi:hypothetical protein